MVGWLAIATLALGAPFALAQQTAPAPQTAAVADQDEEDEAPLSQAQLEQLVAPIALYPDDLLSQVMMASTYPLEVIEAARWVKANPDMKGDALKDAMEQQSWDPSVKALVPFPEVLEMMNDQLSWMQQLGDAFLAQQEDVLAAVQSLRAKADAEGTLKTTEQQTVKKETVASTTGTAENVYVIRPTNPDVVYVPVYDPLVVYGTWPYPAYRPYYWYPPAYPRGYGGLWFAAGVAFGYALWGDVDWRRRNVYINVNRYNRYNRVKINNRKWTHKPRHRKGVPYRHKRVAKKYGKPHHYARNKPRRDYRGHPPRGGKPNRPPPKGGRPPKDLAKVRPVQPLPKDKRPAKVRPAQPRPKDSRPPKASKPNIKKPVAKAKPKQTRPARPKAKAPPRKKAAKPRARPKQPAAFKGAGKGRQVKRNSARGKASRNSARSRGGKGRGGRRRG